VVENDQPFIYTKDSLIEKLKQIAKMGWIPNARHKNQGGVGNTLEDLLGIEENNLPLPNAAEWELKSQRLKTSSLTTLFHMEPSPRAVRFVPQIFLPKYGCGFSSFNPTRFSTKPCHSLCRSSTPEASNDIRTFLD